MPPSHVSGRYSYINVDANSNLSGEDEERFKLLLKGLKAIGVTDIEETEEYVDVDDIVF